MNVTTAYEEPCFECGEPADQTHHVVPNPRDGNVSSSALTREGLARKKASGERYGQVPYGRRLADDGVRLLLDPAGLAAVDRIVQLRKSGMSLRSIASDLDLRGVPTKSGRPWKHSTVNDILNRLRMQPDSQTSNRVSVTVE